MIYIRVEAWPGGRRSKADLISEIVVANVSDCAEDSEYEIQASQRGGFKAEPFRLNSLTQSGKHRDRLRHPLEDSVLTVSKIRHYRSQGLWLLLQKVFRKISWELTRGS